MVCTFDSEPASSSNVALSTAWTQFSPSTMRNSTNGWSLQEAGMAQLDDDVDHALDVLIATPGRLLDFSERGKLLLTAIEILVIDEAGQVTSPEVLTELPVAAAEGGDPLPAHEATKIIGEVLAELD